MVLFMFVLCSSLFGILTRIRLDSKADLFTLTMLKKIFPVQWHFGKGKQISKCTKTPSTDTQNWFSYSVLSTKALLCSFNIMCALCITEYQSMLQKSRKRHWCAVLWGIRSCQIKSLRAASVCLQPASIYFLKGQPMRRTHVSKDADTYFIITSLKNPLYLLSSNLYSYLIGNCTTKMEKTWILPKYFYAIFVGCIDQNT